MVTALRKLHAGKLRADGRMEIPNLDGHPMGNEVLEESSEIISFAEKGAWTMREILGSRERLPLLIIEKTRYVFKEFLQHLIIKVKAILYKEKKKTHVWLHLETWYFSLVIEEYI